MRGGRRKLSVAERVLQAKRSISNVGRAAASSAVRSGSPRAGRLGGFSAAAAASERSGVSSPTAMLRSFQKKNALAVQTNGQSSMSPLSSSSPTPRTGHRRSASSPSPRVRRAGSPISPRVQGAAAASHHRRSRSDGDSATSFSPRAKSTLVPTQVYAGHRKTTPSGVVTRVHQHKEGGADVAVFVRESVGDLRQRAAPNPESRFARPAMTRLRSDDVISPMTPMTPASEEMEVDTHGDTFGFNRVLEQRSAERRDAAARPAFRPVLARPDSRRGKRVRDSGAAVVPTTTTTTTSRIAPLFVGLGSDFPAAAAPVISSSPMMSDAASASLAQWDAAQTMSRQTMGRSSSSGRGNNHGVDRESDNSFMIDSDSEVFGAAASQSQQRPFGSGSGSCGGGGGGGGVSPLASLVGFDADGGSSSESGRDGSGGGSSPTGNILSRSGRHFHVDVIGRYGMAERVSIGIDGPVAKTSPDKAARGNFRGRTLRSRQEAKPVSRSGRGRSRSGSGSGSDGAKDAAAKEGGAFGVGMPFASSSPVRGAGRRPRGFQEEEEEEDTSGLDAAFEKKLTIGAARPRGAAGGGREARVRQSEAGVRGGRLRPIGVAPPRRPRTGPSRVSTAPSIGSGGGRSSSSVALPSVHGTWWKRAAISGVHTPSGDAAIMGNESGGFMPVDWWPQSMKKLDGLIEISCLGRGASGTVHACLSISTLTVVAVKHIVVGGRGRIGAGVEMDPQTKAAHTEFRTLYELNHFPLVTSPGKGDEDPGEPCPYIIRSYDTYFDYAKGRLGVVLEYCNGALSDLIRSGAAGLPALHAPGSARVASNELSCTDHLTEAQLGNIAWHVLKGIEFMHTRRPLLLHRDLKPANILISHSVGPKITDFGISKMLDSSVANAQTFLGTLAYLSPERVRGMPYGAPADIWAVGKTVVALARGTEHERVNIFKMLNATDDTAQHWLPHDDPCRPSEELCDFTQRCLEINPDNRWSVRDLLEHPFIIRGARERTWKCPSHIGRPVCTIEQFPKIADNITKRSINAVKLHLNQISGRATAPARSRRDRGRDRSKKTLLSSGDVGAITSMIRITEGKSKRLARQLGIFDDWEKVHEIMSFKTKALQRQVRRMVHKMMGERTPASARSGEGASQFARDGGGRARRNRERGASHGGGGGRPMGRLPAIGGSVAAAQARAAAAGPRGATPPKRQRVGGGGEARPRSRGGEARPRGRGGAAAAAPVRIHRTRSEMGGASPTRGIFRGAAAAAGGGEDAYTKKLQSFRSKFSMNLGGVGGGGSGGGLSLGGIGGMGGMSGMGGGGGGLSLQLGGDAFGARPQLARATSAPVVSTNVGGGGGGGGGSASWLRNAASMLKK